MGENGQAWCTEDNDEDIYLTTLLDHHETFWALDTITDTYESNMSGL